MPSKAEASVNYVPDPPHVDNSRIQRESPSHLAEKTQQIKIMINIFKLQTSAEMLN